MKKKTLSLILALLMVVSLLPVSALADGSIVQSGNCGIDGNIKWTLDDAGVLTITGTGEIASDTWRDYKDDIKSVVIGEGVTGICYWAFQSCSNLSEVSLPKSTTFIGGAHFRVAPRCAKLTFRKAINTLIPSRFTVALPLRR